MTQADSVFSSRPNMHRSEKFRTERPNSGRPVHVVDVEPEARQHLNVDQMRGRLSSTNLHPGGTVPAKAIELGRRYRVDSDDLLQGAVVRSLGQRTVRPEMPAELFLTQLMRSVGSSIARARSRAREREDDFKYSMRVQSVATRVGLRADDLLQLEADQLYYSGLLDEAAGGDELLAKLIDGIGHGLRGAALAAFMEISQADLASPRRALKRRAQVIARREALFTESVTEAQGGKHA